MPRIGHPGGVRPAWYDRNPVAQRGGAFLTIGPHAETARVTYTVPTGKKYVLLAASVSIVRIGTATTGDLTLSAIRVVGQNHYIVTAEFYNPTQSVQQNMSMGTELYFAAGEGIAWITADASTGGTVRYTGFFGGVEFDA